MVVDALEGSGRLEMLRRRCRELDVDVPLDFERDFWRFAAADCILEIAVRSGAGAFLRRLFEKAPLRVPERVRRGSLARKRDYLMLRWPQERVKDYVESWLWTLFPAASAGDWDRAVADCAKAGLSESVVFLLAKASGDEDAAQRFESAAPPAKALEWARARYEVVLREYCLRQKAGDPLSSLVRSEVERRLSQYSAEIRRLREKLARACAVSAEKAAEARRHREEAERALGELRSADEALAEMCRLYGELSSWRAGMRKRDAVAAEGEGGGAAVPAATCPGRLAGRTVCVVGDVAHAAGYEALLRGRGAELRFVDGLEGEGEVRAAVKGSAAVLVVAGAAKHKVALPARSEAARLDRPLAMVSRAGLASFAAGLEELERKLESASGTETDRGKGGVAG